eukprot:365503-Chlamydomonas_euryale.AAC.4
MLRDGGSGKTAQRHDQGQGKWENGARAAPVARAHTQHAQGQGKQEIGVAVKSKWTEQWVGE